MNYYFGKSSEDNLSTAHPELQEVMRDALATGIMDFSIIEGHRSKALQNRYYDLGKSKVKYPDSKHNKIPSAAVDAVPFINGAPSWNKLHCCILAGIILACAAKRKVKLRWGGNWDMDGEPITDQDFQDLAHFEKV
jgi:peptidoglycan L-alanyl-D-glutamate endopeptidase CwlK